MALENSKGPLKDPLEDYKDCLWIALRKLKGSSLYDSWKLRKALLI